MAGEQDEVQLALPCVKQALEGVGGVCLHAELKAAAHGEAPSPPIVRSAAPALARGGDGGEVVLIVDVDAEISLDVFREARRI